MLVLLSTLGKRAIVFSPERRLRPQEYLCFFSMFINNDVGDDDDDDDGGDKEDTLIWLRT